MRQLRSAALLFTLLAVSACGSTTKSTSSPAEPSTTTASPTTVSTPGTTAPTDTTAPNDTAPPSTGASDVGDTGDLVDRVWIVDGMITIGGVQAVPDVGAFLQFSDEGGGVGSVQINTGCNTGSADVIYSGSESFAIGPIALTKEACNDEINSLETIIVALLDHPQRWSISDDTLTLIPLDITDSGLQLRVEGSVPVSTTPTDDTSPGSLHDTDRLFSTSWVADRFITVGPPDPVPSNSGAGLHFENETTITINTGCNDASGTVTFADDGGFTVGPPTITDVACDDNGLEARIVGLFAHPLQWLIDGDALTIYPTDVTDDGLVLRDADADAAEPTTSTTAQDAAAADRAAVLATTAATRLTVDNSFGGQPTFIEVAIVDHLGQPDSNGMIQGIADGVALTGGEKAAIEDAIAPITVRWTSDPQDPVVLVGQAAGQLSGVLTLSEPVIDGSTASIVSGLFCGSLCGIGGAYTIERQAGGTWAVTDRPGPQWIS